MLDWVLDESRHCTRGQVKTWLLRAFVITNKEQNLIQGSRNIYDGVLYNIS